MIRILNYLLWYAFLTFENIDILILCVKNDDAVIRAYYDTAKRQCKS